MRLRNHTYIHDGIMYQNYIFDENGVHCKVGDVWLRWQKKRAETKPPLKVIKSFDHGYVNSNVSDVRVCGSHELVLVTTKSNRKFWTGLDAQVVTSAGPVTVRNLGIGAELIALDNYKNYYGDTIKLETTGNARARALLRNHGIPFEVLPNGGTRTDDYEVHVMDFEVEGVINNGGVITLGINNYRETMKLLFELPDYTTDEVVSIDPKMYKKYLVAIYVDGPQNIVLQNGLVIQSPQTEVRHDW